MGLFTPDMDLDEHAWAIPLMKSRERLLALLSHLTSLRHLGFEDTSGAQDIAPIHAAAPWLTWLDMGSSPDWVDGPGERKIWLREVTRYTSLQVLHGAKLFASRNPANEGIARDLMEACPKLQRVDAWEDAEPGSYIALFRDLKGHSRWEIRTEGA